MAPWLLHANESLSLTPPFTDLLHQTLIPYILSFVHLHIDHPSSRQLCFELIGNELTGIHFSKHEDTPFLLLEPYMSQSVKESMIRQFRRDLHAHILKEAKDDKFHGHPQFKAFLLEMADLYQTKLDTFKRLNGQTQNIQNIQGNDDVLNEIGTALASILDSSGFPTQLSSIDPSLLQYFSGSSSTSDDEAPHHHIFARLRGRIFPSPLRRALVLSCLQQPNNNNNSSSESSTSSNKSSPSTNYKTAITTIATQKNVKPPYYKTDISFIVEHSLKRAINDSMILHTQNEVYLQHLISVGVKVLNLYYVLTGRTSVPLAYSILPLLVEFYDPTNDNDDESTYHVLGLVNEFQKIVDASPHVELAAAAQTLLSSIDPQLHAHLSSIFSLSSESTFNSGGKKIEALFREILELRFVSLLGFESQLHFAWDHCFLHGWSSSIPALLCVDILILQRNNLLLRFKEGGINECLELLRSYRHDILTSQLVERYKYYRINRLLADVDLRSFKNKQDKEMKVADSAAYQSVGLLFKYSDRNARAYDDPHDANDESSSEEEEDNDPDPEVVELMANIITQVEQRGEDARKASVEVQRRLVKEEEERKVVGKKEEETRKLKNQVQAVMLIKRMIKTAVARRRVKKAKEERKAILEKIGAADDTSKEVYSVQFDSSTAMGMAFRDASDQTLERARELKLLKAPSEKEGKGGPVNKYAEVSNIKEESQGERLAIAPGDLLLKIGGVSCLNKRELKKLVAVETKKGKLITFEFLRGLKIRAGELTPLA
jgi:hypothetical protein